MTEKILTEFKQEIQGLTLVPSDGGRFELSLNGELVYSKMETGEFPTFEALRDKVKERLERS